VQTFTIQHPLCSRVVQGSIQRGNRDAYGEDHGKEGHNIQEDGEEEDAGEECSHVVSGASSSSWCGDHAGDLCEQK
jgi:hypothetical protein